MEIDKEKQHKGFWFLVCQGKTTQTDKSQKSEGKRDSRQSGLPILIITIIYYFTLFFNLYYTITCNPMHIYIYIYLKYIY